MVRFHDFGPQGLPLDRCNLTDWEQLLREGCGLAIRMMRSRGHDEPLAYEHFVTYEQGRGFVSDVDRDRYRDDIFELIESFHSAYDPLLVACYDIHSAEEVGHE